MINSRGPTIARHTPGSPIATPPAMSSADRRPGEAKRKQEGRQRLRGQQLDRRDRRGQQRLEGLRLFLADHGVRRQRRRRHDRDQQQQQRELVEQEGLDQARCRSGRPAPGSGPPRSPPPRRTRRTPRASRPAIIGATDDDEERGNERAEHHRDGGRIAPGLRISSRASFAASAVTRCHAKALPGGRGHGSPRPGPDRHLLAIVDRA